MSSPSFSPVHNWQKKTGLFLVSQNISLLGSSVVGYAILWHITLETSSGWWLTLATIAFTVPGVIISLWGGVWADRYNRKRLIILADASVALATLAVAIFFWFGFKSLELLLVASTFRSLGGGVQAPAVNAIYTQLAPPEQLARVQGLNQSLGSVSTLLAPVLGGLILGLVGLEAAFMVDVLTAAAAMIILGRIKIPPTESGAVGSTWVEMRAGLAYAWGERPLRRLLICIGLFFFLVTPAAILTPLMVARSFGPEVWRLTANEAVWSLASFAGGIFVARHGDFEDKPRTLAICLAAFGLFFGLLGLAENFILYLTLMGLAGFFLPVYVTAETVFIQQTADPAKLGRVFSISQILSSSAMPAAILVFGPLADLVSVESLLIVSGLMLLSLAGAYYAAGRA